MKEGIHPDYREVCFVDLSNGFQFVTRSCVNTKETIKLDDPTAGDKVIWNGNIYESLGNNENEQPDSAEEGTNAPWRIIGPVL